MAKTVIAFIFFLLFILTLPFLVQAEGVDFSRVEAERKTGRLERPERMAILQPERIVKTLRIQPGMTILDIGAGSGFFSFQFADALNGTGKVYATDVDSSMIEYMKGRAADSGYDDVIPVLVKFGDIDPFYTQHQFDIIFMSGVYFHLWRHVDYFSKLRPSLKKNGRLFILQPKNEIDFNEAKFSDFNVVMNKFHAEGDAFPVFQQLGSDVQAFIKDSRQDKVPSEIRIRIVEDFNKMLSDRTLFYDLLDYYYTNKGLSPHVAISLMSPQQPLLIKWLAAQLDENGVFNKEGGKLADMDKKGLHKLNNLLLEGMFELRTRFGSPQNFYLEEKNSVIRKLKSADYRFVRDHDFLTHHYFLEFKRVL